MYNYAIYNYIYPTRSLSELRIIVVYSVVVFYRFSLSFVSLSRRQIFERVYCARFVGLYFSSSRTNERLYNLQLTTFPLSLYLLIPVSVLRGSFFEGFPFKHLSSSSPVFTFSFCHSCANPVCISQC